MGCAQPRQLPRFAVVGRRAGGACRGSMGEKGGGLCENLSAGSLGDSKGIPSWIAGSRGGSGLEENGGLDGILVRGSGARPRLELSLRWRSPGGEGANLDSMGGSGTRPRLELSLRLP